MNTQQVFGIPIKEVMMPNYEQVIKEAKLQILPLFDNIVPDEKRVKAGSAYYSGLTGSKSVYFDVKQDLASQVDITAIKNWVEEQATEFWKDLQLNPRLTPKVINSWCNLGPPGSCVWPHQHTPVVINCVFYLDSTEEMGNLMLQNPMEQILAHQPYEMTYGVREFDHELKAVTGKLVMFPGWVKHYTRPNLTNEVRMSMALNVIGIGGINALLGKDDDRTVEMRSKYTSWDETGTPQ